MNIFDELYQKLKPLVLAIQGVDSRPPSPEEKDKKPAPKTIVHDDPWDQAKHDRGGDAEWDRVKHLPFNYVPEDHEEYDPEEVLLQKADPAKPSKKKTKISEKIVNQIAAPDHGDYSEDLKGLDLSKLYRAYKNTPHRPESMGLKYLIHRIENVHTYSALPEEGKKQLDQEFMELHQHEKNEDIGVNDLHNFTRQNPHLIDSLIAHQRKLHTFIKKNSQVQHIDGQPYVALTRGLHVDKNQRGRDHALASYADIPNTGFGKYMHHQLVPLKNIWYSFDFGPSAATSEQFGNENEFLVSPHENKYTDVPTSHFLVPRNLHEKKDIDLHDLFEIHSPLITTQHIDAALKDSNKDVRAFAIKHPKATVQHIDTALKDSEWSIRKEAIKHPKATVQHIDTALKDSEWLIRKEAIKHPNATAQHIDTALKDSDSIVRELAIQHPKATVQHIDTALKDSEWPIRKAAIKHPNATAQHIDAALKDSHEDVRELAIQHPNATVQHIDTALKDSELPVREAAIKHPNATAQHIDIALKDSEWLIRESAIKHPNATAQHIDTALKDIHNYVRGAAINHPKATAQHIDTALKDSEWPIRKAAIEHPNATAQHIDTALKDSNADVRKAAIKHPNATVQHIDTALKDSEWPIRKAAIKHPNATAQHIDIALKDSDSIVRELAIQHPNATVQHIDTALKDSHEDVREAAKHAKKQLATQPKPSPQPPSPTSPAQQPALTKSAAPKLPQTEEDQSLQDLSPRAQNTQNTINDLSDETEYKNARESKFKNKGIDITNAARHKRKESPKLDAITNLTKKQLVAQSPMELVPSNVHEAKSCLYHHHVLDYFPKSASTPSTFKPIQTKLKQINETMDSFEGGLLGKIAKSESERHFRHVYDIIRQNAHSSKSTIDSNGSMGIHNALSQKVRDYVNNAVQEIKAAHGTDAERTMLNTKLLAVEPMRQFFNKAFARAGALKDHKQFDVQWQKKFGKMPPHQTDLDGLTPQQHKEYSQKYVEHVSHITTGGDPDELWYGKDNTSSTFTPVKKVESVTRVGDDHGFKDHTDHEAYIMDMAKMKGLQYGNSVTDKERAHHLSHLANSFKDLASILNVPDKMVSMNGRLSVAVGARGTKGAMAHYAPNLRVINLTRAKGSGTLAHEWAHAFDDHIGRITNNKDNFSGFASFGHGNHDLNKHFNNLKQALDEFQDRVYEEHFTKPSKERQSKIHYWIKNEELFARAFEGYVHTKLSKSGKENNYLINHQTHKDNNYLWPNQQERDKHEKLFDDLFSAFRNSDLLHKSMKIFDPSYVYDAKHFELLNKSDSADQPIMQVSSVAVIYHNHLLMGKRRDTQKWTLPGGKVDRGESPDAAAYREVFEEAGIDARHHQLHILGSGDVISAEGNPIKVHSYALFEYFPTDSSKDPDKEVDEWAWIDISKGLPDHIKNNLHNPKNVTLNLLGLMSW